MNPNFIYNFICSLHPNGRTGFTDDGFNHYSNVLLLIWNKMMNPEIPESKFVTLCCEEKWDYAESIADTRNREAIEVCDMFREFSKYVKKHPEYIQRMRNKKLEELFKIKGDHGSVGEEILMEIPELELQCSAVKKAIDEGYFTLEEALKNYNVTREEYLTFINFK